MAEQNGSTIAEVPLVFGELSGREKMPVSNGTGKDLTVSVEQIARYSLPTGTTTAEFSISDDLGHEILRLEGGHIRTKNFDSSNIKENKDGVEEAPQNGGKFVRQNGKWVPESNGSGGIPDAPKDGTKYVRQNGNWVKETASSGGGGGIPEAPSDGNLYGRKNKGWAKIPTQSGVAEPMKTIKVLSIGNSYSMDAFTYVPSFLESVFDGNINIVWGILHISGASLQDHLNAINGNKRQYRYFKYTKDSGKFIETSNAQSSNDILVSEAWDIVTTHQSPIEAARYDTYFPTLTNLINKIYSIVTHPIKIGWLQTPALGKSSHWLGDNSDLGNSDQMFAKIADASKNLLRDSPISFIIPVGAAVQNARRTRLDTLGDAGNLMQDTLHLQEGAPCQIASYAVVQSILPLIDSKRGILGDKTIIDTNFVLNNITYTKQSESQGKPVYTSDKLGDILIAQKCAIAACNNPYIITQIK